MKILEILGASKEAKEKKAIERAGRALSRGQGALMDKLEAEKDNLQDKLDKLLDIKADNVSETWNEDFHNAKVELSLKLAEIKICQETTDEYFSEAKK